MIVHALFGRKADAMVFVGPLIFAQACVVIGRHLGVGPEVGLASWLLFVVGIDVAHVWSTLWVSVLHGEQLRAHGLRFLGLAVGLYGLAAATYFAWGAVGFWRAVAYIACFHFVRQQIGWVHLARSRAGEFDAFGARLDAAVAALLALEPLAYWHVHGRSFGWMTTGDFITFSPGILLLIRVLLAAAGLLFVVREAARARGGTLHLGKLLVVVSTGLSWHWAIESSDNDFVFTAFNTTAHAAPYVYLVATRSVPGSLARRSLDGARTAAVFLGILALAGLLEETAWDYLVWGERLFSGPPPWLRDLAPALVPLLVLPQLTHYALDAFLWRRQHRPSLRGTS